MAAGSTGGLRTVLTMSSAIGPRYRAPAPLRPSSAYVSARSGFLKVEPTTGRAPPGRKSFLVSGKSLKRSWLASVWARKVASTVNPSRASFSAGLRRWPSERLPQASRAFFQVAGVPGTPTERPLVWPSANGMGAPFSWKSSAVAVLGAVSRPSMVCTRRDAAS